MARLRYNGLQTTLGAPLTAADTTITFAAALTSASGAVPTIAGGNTIPLTILTSMGAVSEIVSLTAYTSGATTGAIARAQESTTASAHASGDGVVHSPTVADFAGSTGASRMLTSALWNPATLTQVTTASTTFVDVNAALTVTFTAPSNGQVLVTLSANAGVSTATAAGYWNLRDSVGDVAGTERGVSSASTVDVRTVPILVSGLTGGASYTWKWGHRIHSSSFTALFNAGGNTGPATMLVYATQ